MIVRDNKLLKIIRLQQGENESGNITSIGSGLILHIAHTLSWMISKGHGKVMMQFSHL